MIDGAPTAPRVLFEDDWLLVVSKPAGMATQAGRGASDTLEAWARDHLGASAIRNGFTVGAAHRLDRGTSGVVVLAKRRPAMAGFSRQLSDRRVRKSYLALVKGVPRPAKSVIRTPLVDLHGAFGVPQEASTRYETIASSSDRSASLLWCRPETGRMHQIRRHLAGMLHPLAGDDRYGDAGFSAGCRAQWVLERLFLHAASIAFAHPRDGAALTFSAPLPTDLIDVLAKAGIAAPTVVG